MKKLLLFGALSCVVAFYACKKGGDTIDGDDEQPEKIDTVHLGDRTLLATKVKVAFGIYSTGDMPKATDVSGTPTLVEDKNIVNAISGRYIVVKPNFEYYESTVKGYYVSINSSSSFFKVDYSSRRGFYRQAPGLPETLGREGDYVDSSIIIKLPPYIQGDTLSLTYAAYDSLDHVSNHVRSLVRVHSQNDIADFQDFVGMWKVNRKTDANGVWQNYYIPDTARTSFTCEGGKLKYCINSNSECFEGVSTISGVTKYDMMFTDQNEFAELFSASASRVILENSTCENFVYGKQTQSKIEKGGWSFNPENKVMTIVVDNNGLEGGAFYSYSVKFLEMTPQMITIVNTANTSYQVELIKK